MNDRNDLYKLLYQVLSDYKKNKESLILWVNNPNTDRIERNQILHILSSYKLIDGFVNQTQAASGDYSIQIRDVHYLSVNGLRFLKYYENYSSKDIDILSLLNDNSAIIEYYVNKEKYSGIVNAIWSIFLIVLTAIITALINKNIG